MAKKQDGQGNGAGTGQPTSPIPSTPQPGPAPKFCPSCGKPVHSFRDGKATYCEGCRHVFDEHGQGRPADFMDRLERLESRPTTDPRVDRLDSVVGKLSEMLTGQRRSIQEIDPDNQEQMSKFAMAGGFLKTALGSMFKPRPKAPAAAAPAAPPKGQE